MGWPHTVSLAERDMYWLWPPPSSSIGDAMDGLLQVLDPDHTLINGDDGRRDGLRS
jgi:hypothetical protein